MDNCEHINVEYYSECCGVEMVGLDLDYRICPNCLEHCVIYECCLDCDNEEELD